MGYVSVLDVGVEAHDFAGANEIVDSRVTGLQGQIVVYTSSLEMRLLNTSLVTQHES